MKTIRTVKRVARKNPSQLVSTRGQVKKRGLGMAMGPLRPVRNKLVRSAKKVFKPGSLYNKLKK